MKRKCSKMFLGVLSSSFFFTNFYFVVFGAAYNSKYVNQGTLNLHVSKFNDIYKEASGLLLLSQLISGAEGNFILAEASERGWLKGAADSYYKELRQSLNVWGLEILLRVIFQDRRPIWERTIQRWIASWSTETEAWFDFRRTSIPNLLTWKASNRGVLPLCFYYHIDEIENNLNAEGVLRDYLII